MVLNEAVIPDANMKDSRTDFPISIVCKNYSIKVAEDSVMRVGSLICCSSPNKSEISHKRRVFESYCKEARLQFKSPKR